MFDVLNIFTRHQTSGSFFQVIGADAASINLIDLDVAGISIQNPAKPIWIVARVGVVFETLTDFQIALETDSDSAFATTLKQVQVWEFLVGQMTAGAVLINQALPVFDYQRYMRIKFITTGGSNGSTGSIMVALTDTPETAITDLDQVAETT